ncbi:hypothetical protein [Gelidibacter mesophilus]|uniref:hypothetical protein n=1 Tax=Gelidibacter mesophilus TaxID=169050 RepID=UPI000415F7D9|nr:hypothetical protein [Gelidibacter mesophilus]
MFGVSETIDWTLAKSFEKENTVAVEVPLLLKQDFNLVTDQSNNLLDATHRLVFIKKNDSEIVSFIISISSFNQESKVVNDLDNFNYFDISNDFSGRIVVIDNAANITNNNVILIIMLYLAKKTKQET